MLHVIYFFETPRRQDAEAPRRQDAEPPKDQNGEMPRRRNAETPRRRNAVTPRRRTPRRRGAEIPRRRNAETPRGRTSLCCSRASENDVRARPRAERNLYDSGTELLQMHKKKISIQTYDQTKIKLRLCIQSDGFAKTTNACYQNEAGVEPNRSTRDAKTKYAGTVVCGKRWGQNEACVAPKQNICGAKTKHGRSQNNVYAMPRRHALRN